MTDSEKNAARREKTQRTLNIFGLTVMHILIRSKEEDRSKSKKAHSNKDDH
jgi:hypothetical protein